MRLTIFGGTGAAGQLLIQQALAAGHQVTAYARNPNKLEDRPGLTVVAGELDDAAAVEKAIDGTEAVISLLGPGTDKAGIPPLVPGMQTIVDAMTRAGVRRLIATSTPSAPDPADRRDLRIRLMVSGIRLGMPDAYRAIVSMAEVVRGSSLDWTLVRLPLLHDKPADGPAVARRIGEPGGLRLSRSALATFLLQEATQGAWHGGAPLIADR